MPLPVYLPELAEGEIHYDIVAFAPEIRQLPELLSGLVLAQEK